LNSPQKAKHIKITPHGLTGPSQEYGSQNRNGEIADDRLNDTISPRQAGEHFALSAVEVYLSYQYTAEPGTDGKRAKQYAHYDPTKVNDAGIPSLKAGPANQAVYANNETATEKIPTRVDFMGIRADGGDAPTTYLNLLFDKQIGQLENILDTLKITFSGSAQATLNGEMFEAAIQSIQVPIKVTKGGTLNVTLQGGAFIFTPDTLVLTVYN
jgi:hypothetical protein